MNPISYVSTQTVEKPFSKTDQTATLESATDAVGDVSYAINSQKNSSEANVTYFSINGTTLTVAGNTSPGTYRVVVRATAAGDDDYASVSKDSTVTVTVNAHPHNFTYADNGGDTITATCDANGCDLTDNKATLTIAAPKLTAVGGTGDATATLTGLADFNTATGLTVSADSIQYYKATKSGTTYTKGDALNAAPTGEGNYLAEITISGVKTSEGEGKSVAASVGYTITAPDYSSYLVEASNYNGDFDDAGFWDWGNSILNGKTISRDDALVWAQYKKQQTGNATAILYTSDYNELYYITDTGATGSVLMGDTIPNTNLNGYKIYALKKTTPDGIVPTSSHTHSFTYSASGATITATCNADDKAENCPLKDKEYKATLTIAANTPVGSYTVVVRETAAGNNNYISGAVDSTVAVTVNAANLNTDKPAEISLVYDQTSKKLVKGGSVSDGGRLMYALGKNATDVPPDEAWSDDIPEGTAVGTYYVWYKVVGDANHNGVDPACVVVTIAEPAKTEASSYCLAFRRSTPSVWPIGQTEGVVHSYLCVAKIGQGRVPGCDVCILTRTRYNGRRLEGDAPCG